MTVEATVRDIWPNNKDKKEGVVTRNRILNPGQPEGKVFREVELGLDGIQFKAGDVCGIIPVNDQREIDRLLQVLGIDASQEVMFGKEMVKAGDLLANKIEIIRATDNFLKMLHARDQDHTLRGKDLHLIERALGDEALLKGLKDNAIADIIEHFGLEGVTIEDIAGTSKRLTPRLYTASSSPLMQPNAVHMTVADVTLDSVLGDKEIAQKRGVCTGYMSGWNERDLASGKEGDKRAFFMQAKKGFRLPEVLDRPIVMIGPGTGIAPMRAFVQEIAASGKEHKDVVLYSGGQYEVDALYRKEFEHAFKQGVLTEQPHYAISRTGKKQRVQALLKADAAHIRDLVDKGAIFYICGGEKMGEEVVHTLNEIAPELAAQAKERIKMDVY